MIEPVVGLELDPRRRQQVEDGRRSEIVGSVAFLRPAQQPVADQPRTWIEEVPVAGRIDLGQRDVAAKARSRIAQRVVRAVARVVRIEAGVAHRRLGEIIPLAVLLALAEIARIIRDRLPKPVGFGDRDVGGVVKIFLAQHIAQRPEVEDPEEYRQFVPGYEEIEEFEDLVIDEDRERFRIVLLHDQPEREAAEDRESHQEAEQTRDDFRLLGEHGGAEEHDEGDDMQSAALRPQPLVVVGDDPRQSHIQRPPDEEEDVGTGMLDQTFGMFRRGDFAVEDDAPVAAAQPGHRPIDMDRKRQKGSRPERPPIGVGRGAIRENVETQRRRHQDDGGPEGEDHDVVGGGGSVERPDARIHPRLQHPADKGERQEHEEQHADEDVPRPRNGRTFRVCAHCR